MLQVRALFELKFRIFPLITYFRYHVTEYCAVIGMHSTVWGDKLLYGQIPDLFPRCGIGSGHARLGLAKRDCNQQDRWLYTQTAESTLVAANVGNSQASLMFLGLSLLKSLMNRWHGQMKTLNGHCPCCSR